MTGVKKKDKGPADSFDYKAAMEHFRENIREEYYEKAVRLMDELEEKRREEEMETIALQSGKLRRTLSKKTTITDADLKREIKDAKDRDSQNPTPVLDEHQIKERIEKAGHVFKRFSSLISKKQELLLNKLIHKDSMQIDPAVESDGKMMQQLYELFFAWTTDEEVAVAEEPGTGVEELTEEEKWIKAKQKEEDRKKREEFERDQALHDFKERGGFKQVL